MSEQPDSSNKNTPRGFQSRKLALQVLIRVHESGAYSNLALSQALKNCQFSKRDKAFVTLLVQGVTRNLAFVDDIIGKFSKTPLAKLPGVLLNTLRLGIYQLEFLEDTPPPAVLNTSTALAKACGHKGMASYTTAVLRSYLRAREAEGGKTFRQRDDYDDKYDGEGNIDLKHIDAPSNGDAEFDVNTADVSSELEDAPLRNVNDKRAGESPTNRAARSSTKLDPLTAAKKYSLPEWLVKRWFKNFSENEAVSLLKYSTSEPRIVLRANELLISADEFKSKLKDADVEFEQSSLVPSCMVLTGRGRGRGNPSELSGYAEGLFSIQDDTAAIVGKVVDPQPGDLIIDLCAAPGGKALHMGELMKNKGRIIAVDTRAKRLELVKTNRRRLGVMNIELFEADGTTFEFQPQADKILVDAPCSGTGVLNRRADLRHRRKEEDIESLAALQYELLDNAQRLLKPGGVLVYATCTVEPEENEQVVEKFLENHPDFSLSDLNPYFPREFVEQHQLESVLKTGKIQILPTIAGLSGFYIARLVRA